MMWMDVSRTLKVLRAREVMWCLAPFAVASVMLGAPVYAAAPTASSYLGLGEDCCGEDPHPVHGITTSDGGYVLVGKSADASGSTDGFILKVNARAGAMNTWVGPGTFQPGEWAVMQGTRGGLDGMNNIVETANGVLIGVGFQAANDGQIHRYWASYDLQNGTKRWEAEVPGTQASKISAFESLSATRDGGVVVTGVTNAAPGSFEGFKSYGNPVDGQAFVAYYSAAQLAGTTAPSSPMWETLIPNAMSGKAVRQLPGDNAGYVAALAGMEGEAPYVVQLDSNGGIVWQKDYPNHGELTDLDILGDNGQVEGFIIVGHKGGVDGGIDGSITKLTPNGTVAWDVAVGNPVGGSGPFSGLGAGNPNLIFDECWGVRATIDGGAVVGCGTGIEGCDAYSAGSAIGAECRNDPRQMWRGLVVKLDKNGQEVWSSVDSFVAEDEYLESASEYVSLSADGKVVSIVDQGFGIGILALEASPSNRPAWSLAGHGGSSDSSDASDPSDGPDPVDPSDESDATDPADESDASDADDDEGDAEETDTGDEDAVDPSDSPESTFPESSEGDGDGGCAGPEGASLLLLMSGLIGVLRGRRKPSMQ